jgi:UDP-glucuronate 4-epimerase
MRAGQSIPVFGDGSTRRDYTFVDDIVSGIQGAMAYDRSPYEVVNLGNNQTVSLNEMIRALEEALGVTAALDRQPEQPGDVPQTWAAVEKARELLGYAPKTPFREGVTKFVDWLKTAERG